MREAVWPELYKTVSERNMRDMERGKRCTYVLGTRRSNDPRSRKALKLTSPDDYTRFVPFAAR